MSDINGPIAGPLPADERGWERVDVWAGSEGYGDYHVGTAFSTRYRNGNRYVESGYYVESEDDHLTVMEQTHTWRQDGEDGDPYDEDYTYEVAHHLAPDTIEDGERIARSLAMTDERYCLIWGDTRERA